MAHASPAGMAIQLGGSAAAGVASLVAYAGAQDPQVASNALTLGTASLGVAALSFAGDAIKTLASTWLADRQGERDSRIRLELARMERDRNHAENELKNAQSLIGQATEEEIGRLKARLGGTGDHPTIPPGG